MRRALGLDPDAPQQPVAAAQPRLPGAKRRFVADGTVPVTLIHGRRDDATNGAPNRLEAAESALRAEREARLRAERAAVELQTAVHDLRTRLGHAELAMQEALAAKSATEQKLTAVESELDAEREARANAEHELASALVAAEAARGSRLAAKENRSAADEARKKAETSPRTARAASACKPVGPKPVRPKNEPKPVKWWLTTRKKARKRS
ncbi:MAG: hypothetical protein ACREF3_02670 [Acetobacteraceae bacterium]